MNIRRKRFFILTVTALELLIFSWLIGWRLSEWHRAGCTGMMFQAFFEFPSEVEFLSRLPGFENDAGRVRLLREKSAAWQAGIAAGDHVESVDGIPIEETEKLLEHGATLERGDRVTYTVRRGVDSRQVSLVIMSPFEDVRSWLGLGSFLLAGIAFLVISLLVSWARPGSRAAFIFYLMCATGAAIYFQWMAIGLELLYPRGVAPFVGDPTIVAMHVVFFLLSLLLMNLLLHLALVFPRTRPAARRGRPVFIWLHVSPFLPLLLGFLAIVGLAITKPSVLRIVVPFFLAAGLFWAVRKVWRKLRERGRWEFLVTEPLLFWGALALFIVFVAQGIRLIPDAAAVPLIAVSFFAALLATSSFLFLYPVLTCIALYRSYTEATVEEKRQVRWPLWGTIVGLVGATLLSLVGTVMGMITHDLAPALSLTLSMASSFFYILIPVSFAFGILKYRLMEIDVIIQKTLVYTGVTGIVVVSYVVLVYGLGLALVRYAHVESQVVTILATLAVALLFVPVRQRMQRFVDRRFFYRELGYDEARREMAGEVLGAVSLRPLLARLAEITQQAIGSRSVVIFARDPHRGNLLATASVGLPDKVVEGLAVDPPEWASSQLLAPEAWRGDGALAAALERLHAERAALPRLQGEVVGMVTVGRKLGRDAYEAEDESFLAAVADQVSLAIGNLGTRREQVEIGQALEIQRSLLPTVLPERPGLEISARWEPAREVAGDYYDVLDLPGGALGLCIGDVVGKGLPAALLMSSLQATVKAIAPQTESARRVCEDVRRVVCQNLTGGKFVTFFYGRLEGRRLVYTNAGHNPPILARRDGSVRRLEAGGSVMARFFAGSAFEEEEILLLPGDRLVLFTDGVSEARDAAGEELGEDRLVELVREVVSEGAAAIEERIATAARELAGGELHDDLTLLVVAVETPADGGPSA